MKEQQTYEEVEHLPTQNLQKVLAAFWANQKP